jgi:hypothetical protein
MKLSIEDYFKKIDGKDYVIVDYSNYKTVLQDFIRFKDKIFDMYENNQSFDSVIENVRINSKRKQASSVLYGNSNPVVWISGRLFDSKESMGKGSWIGVKDGIFCSLFSHSFIDILRKEDLEQRYEKIPIGIFNITFDNLLVNFWNSKSESAVYRPVYNEKNIVRTFSKSVSCELYSYDSVTTAIQYAISYMGAKRINLISCDNTKNYEFDNSVKIGDRYISKNNINNLSMLHAFCMVAARNGIEVRYDKESMADIPFAKCLDNTEER